MYDASAIQAWLLLIVGAVVGAVVLFVVIYSAVLLAIRRGFNSSYTRRGKS